MSAFALADNRIGRELPPLWRPGGARCHEVFEIDVPARPAGGPMTQERA